jgi:hypothetical protein
VTRIRWAGVVTIPLLAAGCSDPTMPMDPLGTYTLTSVDGAPLPATVLRDAPWREDVLSGSITLAAGGACSVRRSWRVVNESTGQGVVHEFTVPCTYVIQDEALIMTFTDRPDEREPATIRGGAITQIVNGAEWVFER